MIPPSLEASWKAEAGSCPFPPVTRHITTHNDKREAILSTALEPKVEAHMGGPGILYYNCYTAGVFGHVPPAQTEQRTTEKMQHPTPQSHASAQPHQQPNGTSASTGLADTITSGQDIKQYQQCYPVMHEVARPHGSVFRILDFAPGAVAPMHRTRSLDYGFVMEGEINMILDSGETRRMKRGDVIVQRGTMHAWREATGTNWARVGFVLIGFGDRGLALPLVDGCPDLEAPVSQGDDTAAWKQKYDARNKGKELTEWLPWMSGMPPEEMMKEVEVCSTAQ